MTLLEFFQQLADPIDPAAQSLEDEYYRSSRCFRGSVQLAPEKQQQPQLGGAEVWRDKRREVRSQHRGGYCTVSPPAPSSGKERGRERILLTAHPARA
jgi:hypothetical protein